MTEQNHDHDITAEPEVGSTLRRVSRRGLLLGAGAGALAAGIGVVGSTPASATPGKQTPRPTGVLPLQVALSNLPLVGGEEFPIGLFWPPHPFETNLARYTEIKDAGFTFLITGNYLFDPYIVRYALGFADQVGLKVLVSDDLAVKIAAQRFSISDAGGRLTLNREEAGAFIREAHGNYAAHPSFAGLNFFDEPGPDRFPTLGEAFDLYREIAPKYLPYVNLLPNVYGDAYDDYLNGFAEQVRPSLISFDRYPLWAGGVEDPEYFDNWARVRRAGLKAGLPTWVFIQTLGFNGHREPTEAEFGWQVNVSLAYGAKGIQFFTYWTPDPARGEGFLPALLTVEGEKTARYDYARRLNTSWLQPVGRQLKPLVPATVGHANEAVLPKGTEAWTADAYVKRVAGDPIIVSRFTSPTAGDETQWLFLANRSGQKSATAELILNAAMVSTQVFHPETGNYTNTPAKYRIATTLPAGGGALYKLNAK